MIEMAESTPIEILINLRFKPEGITETIQALDEVLSRINRLRQAGVPISTVTSGLGQIRSQATRTAQSIQQVASSGAIFWVTFDRLGITLAMTKEQFDSFQEAVTAANQATSRVPESVEFASEKVAQFAQTMGISNQRAAELVAAYTPLSEATRKVGRSTDELSSRYGSLRRYMRAFQVQLGEAGFAFFRIGYQIYWVSIGLIFYSLSLYRAQQAQIQLQRSALSLLRTQYALQDQEERLQEIIREYGPASREAQRAARDLAIMRIRQRIYEEQLRVAIRRTAVAEWSARLTLIPLYINTIAIIWNLFAAVTAKSAAEMADVAQTPAKVGAHMSLIGAIKAHIMATWGLITAKAILRAITIPVIGALTAFASIQIVNALVNRQVEEQMRRLNEEMRKYRAEIDQTVSSVLLSASAFTEWSGSMEEARELANELELEMTGRSLNEAILEVSRSSDILRERLEHLRNIQIRYEIIGEPLTQISENIFQIRDRIQRNIGMIVSEYVIRQRIEEARIPEVPDQVQKIRQTVRFAEIPQVQDQTQYIRQVLVPIDIPRVEDQIQRIIREIDIQVNIPESIRKEVQIDIDTPSRITKEIDIDITPRIGEEIEARIARPSRVVLNLNFGDVHIREETDLETIVNRIYERFQSNIREVRYV